MGDLAEAVAKKDRRRALEALAERLAAELESEMSCRKCGAGVAGATAPLAKQLAEVMRELDSLADPEVSRLDELAVARAERIASQVPERAVGGNKRGSGSGGAGGKRRAAPGSVAAGRARGGAGGAT